MHIEPTIVTGAKITLSYATALVSFGLLGKFLLKDLKENIGAVLPMAVKSLIAIVAVFAFFELFPHHAVGVSEVHLILGSSLFLILGVVPTAIGLALGLLLQGVLFAPFDLPQYGMNVTTLLMPLFAMSYLADKFIPKNIAYKDIKYRDTLKLSFIYQGGIISWVGFWALYGQGFGAENLAQVGSFSLAYLSVIILEPFIDLALLALAKSFDRFSNSSFVNYRLYKAKV